MQITLAFQWFKLHSILQVIELLDFHF